MSGPGVVKFFRSALLILNGFFMLWFTQPPIGGGNVFTDFLFIGFGPLTIGRGLGLAQVIFVFFMLYRKRSL